jgi:hypothetical protein
VSWPQIVVALVTLFSAVAGVSRAVRDRKLSSGIATAFVFIHLAIVAGYVLVLHAGGFW